jgi:hypothetical protein
MSGEEQGNGAEHKLLVPLLCIKPIGEWKGLNVSIQRCQYGMLQQIKDNINAVRYDSNCFEYNESEECLATLWARIW